MAVNGSPNTNGSMKRTKSSQDNSDGLLQVFSALTNRLALASKLGYSHNQNRDLYNTLGYPDEIQSKDLIGQWRRQGIARAVVDRPVKKTWQGDILITEPEDEDETELEKKYKQLDEDLGLKHSLLRVDRLANLGEYAVLLLGFDDSSPENWPQPVSDGDRKLMYTRPISKENADIDSYETNPANPRFGLPRIYSIDLTQPDDDGSNTKTKTLKVHYTRIVHVAFDLLESEIEGEPIMKAIYNRLKDLEKLVGGSAEMFWRGARPGYTGSAKEDYKVGEDAEEKLMEQLEEYENNLRRFIVSEGIDINSLAQQVADPKGHILGQLQMVSAATGIPLRILIGSERGELASAQDEQNWKEFIQIRRTEEVEPTIIRPFVDRMIKYGVLPEPNNEDIGYSVVWSDLFTLGEKEKADIGKSKADALAAYVKQPASEQFVPLEAFLQFFLRMDEDQVKQILELRDAELAEMMEEEEELFEDEEQPQPESDEEQEDE